MGEKFPKSSRTVYLNGDFLPLEKACVSVTDFGFTCGGGVYEVVLFHGGAPYRLREHLGRLERSAKGIGLEIPIVELESACSSLIERNSVQTGTLYLQATYGDLGYRSQNLPETASPTLLILIQEMESFPKEMYWEGVALCSAPDSRWEHCNIKSIALLPNIMTLRDVRKRGFFEVVFFEDTSGRVTECAASNVFCVSGGVLVTPPESNKILSGITRTTIIDLARGDGHTVEEKYFDVEEMISADEVFISSTTKEIVPVKSIDGRAVRHSPGFLTRRLLSLLMEDLEKRTSSPHWKRDLLGDFRLEQ